MSDRHNATIFEYLKKTETENEIKWKLVENYLV